MIILDEQETLDRIIKDRCSIARFGDGELKLLYGQGQMYQKPSRALSDALRDIIKRHPKRLLVGVPRWDLKSLKKDKFWGRYFNQDYTKPFEGRTWHSAFITRPALILGIDNKEYWEKMRQIWDGRHVVLVQGKGRTFEHPPNLLSNALRVDKINTVRKDAFTWRYTIRKQIRTMLIENSLAVMSLGPTATVLAYDLACDGYQALDHGHAGMFYSGIHPKSSNYNGTPYDDDK